MQKMMTCLWLFSLSCTLIGCSNEEAILTVQNSEDTQVERIENTSEEEEAQEPTTEENTILVDVATELIANDLTPHPMQDIAKPNYLETIVDPSFGTIIRRISNAGPGGVIKPMYSTIQAWNADETRMILYDQTNGVHQLLNGITYEFIRNLDDVRPDDLEQLFWDFNDPDILYYLDAATNEFVKYFVSTGNKEVLVNLKEISNCTGSISMGNDVQMMSWDSDVIGFRCDNSETFSYRISTQELESFNIDDINYTAAMPAPSGNLFYHNVSSYDASGNFKARLN